MLAVNTVDPGSKLPKPLTLERYAAWGACLLKLIRTKWQGADLRLPLRLVVGWPGWPGPVLPA